MSYTKTDLEILRADRVADIHYNTTPTTRDIPQKRQKSSPNDTAIHNINIVDAKSMLDYLEVGASIAPKFRYIYSHDDYNFGIKSQFVNNCDIKNPNNIKTIRNDWMDKRSKIPHFDLIVSSQLEDAEEIQSAIQKLYENKKYNFYLVLSWDSECKEEMILSQLHKHIYPKIDKNYVVEILESMGLCAKIDFIYRENKRFLSQTDDTFLEKTQQSLKELNNDEKMDVEHYFQKTHNYKRDTGFIKWAMLSW